MNHIKMFEGKKDRGELIISIEAELWKLVDIDIEYFKDMSAGALDPFRDGVISYNESFIISKNDLNSIDHVDSNDDWGDDEYTLSTKDGKFIDSDYLDYDDDELKDIYKELISFYEKIVSTKKGIYYCFSINTSKRTNGEIKIEEEIKSEIDDIKNRCGSDNIRFTYDEDVYSNGDRSSQHYVCFRFFTKLNSNISLLDVKKVLNKKAINDFDTFVKKYNIPKEGESELLNIIKKSKKK